MALIWLLLLTFNIVTILFFWTILDIVVQGWKRLLQGLSEKFCLLVFFISENLLLKAPGEMSDSMRIVFLRDLSGSSF